MSKYKFVFEGMDPAESFGNGMGCTQILIYKSLVKKKKRKEIFFEL